MNTAEGKILCSETKYDVFGRQVLNSMPAPVLNTQFCYEPHFMTADFTAEFEGNTATTNLDYDSWTFDEPTINTSKIHCPCQLLPKDN